MFAINFDVDVVDPALEHNLNLLLQRLANLFNRIGNILNVEIEPTSFDGCVERYSLQNGKFRLENESNGRRMINGGNHEETLVSREEDPSSTKWKGKLFASKGNASVLAGIFEKICLLRESQGMIFTFPDYEETIFQRMIGVTEEDFKRHRSKLVVQAFTMGTIVNGTMFCSHLNSLQHTTGEGKRISHDPKDLILRFDNSAKKMILILRVSQNETKDTIEVERFKLIYDYHSIQKVFVKKYCNGIVQLYFYFRNAPFVLISKKDYISQDSDWADPRKYPKKGDYIHCEDDKLFEPFTKWDNCSIIPSYIIGKSNVVGFTVSENLPNSFSHAPLPALAVWMRYHHLKVHFANIQPIAVPTLPDILMEGANFDLNWALKCPQTISFQFRDDLNVNGTDKFMWFLSEQLPRNEVYVIEALYRLFFIMARCQVYDIYTLFRSKYNELKDKGFQPWYTQANDRIKYLRRVTITPTRLICYPPEPFLMSRFLDVADPEYALRLSIRDENFSDLGFALNKGMEAESFDDPEEKAWKLRAEARRLKSQLFHRGMSRNEVWEAKRQINQSLDMMEKNPTAELLDRCIRKRVLPGLFLIDRCYCYLGASSSQLKDHGMVLYARDSKGQTAQDIRAMFGEVPPMSVAKYIARIGLSLSQVLCFVEIPYDLDCSYIPDIEGGQYSVKPYIFTDGVGKISLDMAKYLFDSMISEGAIECNKTGDERYEKMPSAYQIRFRGCKGMVVIDPTLGSGHKICLRESMRKVDESKSTKIGLLKKSEPRRAYLNRPLIAILNQIGLKNEFFIGLTLQAVKDLIASFMEDKKASEILKLYSNLHRFIDHVELVDNGYPILQDHFFRSSLNLVFHQTLKMIKQRARVPLDMRKARTMFGVVDETNTLEYGEIFAFPSLTPEEEAQGIKLQPVVGPVVVTKFPCLHPGDVRKLRAVDIPALHHIKDCIVFPAKGPRPHSDEMAGSDLDGDEYCVIWQREFLEISTVPPMVFPSAGASTPEPRTDEAIIDFYIKFLREGSIGKIANAHLSWGDCLPRGVFSEMCMRLAEKYSISLDFAKTGITQTLTGDEKCPVGPDFMEKWNEKPSYLSHRALGKMYRMISMFEISFREQSDFKSDTEFDPDPRLIHPSWEEYQKSAINAYELYKARVSDLLEKFGFNSEIELLSNVSEASLAFKEKEYNVSRPNDNQDILNAIIHEHLIKVINSQFEKEFTMGDDTDSNQQSHYEEEKMAKASAYYLVVHNMNKSVTKPIYGLPWIGLPGKYLMELLNRAPKNQDPVEYFKLYSRTIDKKLSYIQNDSTSEDLKERLILAEMVRKNLFQWLDDHLQLVSGLHPSRAQLVDQLTSVYTRISIPFVYGYIKLDSPGRLMLHVLQFLQNKFLKSTLFRGSLQDHSASLGILAMLAYQRLFHTDSADHLVKNGSKISKFKISRKFLIHRIIKETIKNEDLINEIKEKNRDQFIAHLKDFTGVHDVIITPPQADEKSFTVLFLGSPLSVLVAQRLIASYNRPNRLDFKNPLDRL